MKTKDNKDNLKDNPVAAARRRLWAADVACYYAQKRFGQTEDAKDRLIWQNCQKESKEALAAVRAAEEASAQSQGRGC